MKRNFVVHFTLGILICAIAAFESVNAASKIPLTVKLVWSSSYDDNILKYSPRDLDRFENNTESTPSEITTADDWINTFGLRVYRTFKLNNAFRFRPYYSGRLSLYSVNSISNYQYHYFLGRFDYRYRIYLYLQYSYMPGYYLRMYRDRDLDEYHNCEFTMYRPAVRLRYRINPFDIEGSMGREYAYYNEYFTEYDAEADFWGIESSYDTPFGLDVSLGYEYKISDNIGFDQVNMSAPIDPYEDTEYGDSSYEEDRFQLSLGYNLPIDSRWNWKVSIDFDRRLRYYQSELPYEQDRFHTGRKDRRSTIASSISFSPSSTVDLSFRFIYDQRRTDSLDPIVASIKNYVRRTYSVTMIYQIF